MKVTTDVDIDVASVDADNVEELVSLIKRLKLLSKILLRN